MEEKLQRIERERIADAVERYCRAGHADEDVDMVLPRGAGGLPAGSVAKCGEVYTLLKSHLTGICGALGHDQVKQIDRALAIALIR